MADQATFVEDTEPFMQSLFSTAMRLSGNAADAEDLVQETYLRAYRSYESFQEGTNLRAWLFRILTNAHINRYRAASAARTRPSWTTSRTSTSTAASATTPSSGRVPRTS